MKEHKTEKATSGYSRYFSENSVLVFYPASFCIINGTVKICVFIGNGEYIVLVSKGGWLHVE